jgi:hypothetical protein
MSGTTKSHIADGAEAEDQQNVAVFHIVDFHRRQLEVGVHTSEQLTRRFAEEIRRALGSESIVSMRQSGTIVALLPGDRSALERSARQLVERLQDSPPWPRAAHAGAGSIQLSCAIVALSRSEPPPVRPIPEPAFDAEQATVLVG